jgi:acyl-CoA synthetase (AMP-forming)/AMP-acid ligase II
MADLTVEHLDHIFYGGAPMYVEDLKRALSALGPRLWQAYGQGESPCTISYLPPHMHLDNGDGRLDDRSPARASRSASSMPTATTCRRARTARSSYQAMW